MRHLFTILGGAALLAATWASQAGAVALNCNAAGTCDNLTLATLEANQDGFIIGDKQFYNFAADITGFPAGHSTPTTEAQLSINPTIGNGGQREGFSITGLLGAFGPAPASLDIALLYDVKTLSGADLISDYHLSIGGFAIRNGIGSISVDETFTDENNTFLGGISVDTFDPLDEIIFGSLQNHVRVTKDIGLVLLTGGSDARVTLSFIDQAASQEGAVAPEPSSLLLLGTGLLGLGWLRRQQKS